MALSSLTIIIQTRALDRIHYALMLAAANAALDGPTTVFFGIEATEVFGSAGWDGLETAAGEAASAYFARLEAAGVAHPEDLLDAVGELGARIAVCDSGLAVADIAPADLAVAIGQDAPFEVTGLADILASAEGGRLEDVHRGRNQGYDSDSRQDLTLKPGIYKVRVRYLNTGELSETKTVRVRTEKHSSLFFLKATPDQD